MATLHILVTALVVSAAAATVVAAGPDEMTICHKPGTPAEKTMEVPRQAWRGHQGHGDHEGACEDRPGPSGGAGPGGDRDDPPDDDEPLTTLWLRQHATGDVDGTASFRVSVINDGPHEGQGLHLEASLAGQGRWWLAEDGGMTCELEGRHLECDLARLADGERVTVVIAYQGGTTLCREPSVDATLSASNDATSHDNQAEVSVRAGACAAPGVPP